MRRIWRNLRGYDALAFAFHLPSQSAPHCGEGYATAAFRQSYVVLAVYVTGTHCHLRQLRAPQNPAIADARGRASLPCRVKLVGACVPRDRNAEVLQLPHLICSCAISGEISLRTSKTSAFH